VRSGRAACGMRIDATPGGGSALGCSAARSGWARSIEIERGVRLSALGTSAPRLVCPGRSKAAGCRALEERLVQVLWGNLDAREAPRVWLVVGGVGARASKDALVGSACRGQWRACCAAANGVARLRCARGRGASSRGLRKAGRAMPNGVDVVVLRGVALFRCGWVEVLAGLCGCRKGGGGARVRFGGLLNIKRVRVWRLFGRSRSGVCSRAWCGG